MDEYVVMNKSDLTTMANSVRNATGTTESIPAADLSNAVSRAIIPKPLTYDYMPEGYPSKTNENLILMEEQEVTFSSGIGGMSLAALKIKLRDKVTVTWDGVNYEATVTKVTLNSGQQECLVFGNLELLGLEEATNSTNSPFMYIDLGEGSHEWVTNNNTATSHTIGVTCNRTIYTPIDANFMPEGYPLKNFETVTVMKEQEVTFQNVEGTLQVIAPVEFGISDGQTYTIVWDGVEYSCVGYTISGVGCIGNPIIWGLESTGEPFLYLKSDPSTWVSYDTSTSHTIQVFTQNPIYEKIDKNYLPESVFTNADWDFISNRPFFHNKLNANIKAENIACHINAGNNDIDLGVTAPNFDEGLYYKVEGEISFLNNSTNTNHTLQINKYCKAISQGMINLGKVYDEEIQQQLIVAFCGNNYIPFGGHLNIYATNSPSADYTITANFTITGILKKLLEDYIPDTIQRVGDDVIIPSSTPDSNKKFKITVDDSGTISATQVLITDL